MVNPIITAALTGPVATKADNPGLPGSVAEIAASAKAAYDAGAAVIHIHLRDDQGNMTVDLDVARRTVEAVREVCPGIVQLSTGGLAFAYEDRMKLVEAKPAMATLNPCTMTFGAAEFRNPPKQMMQLAARMIELGIKPEVEIYDTGHLGHDAGPGQEGPAARAAAGLVRHGRQGRHAGRSDAARLPGPRAARRARAGRSSPWPGPTCP